MPSTSAKQAKFMRAVAHSPKFAKKVGVPQSVGKDFEMADKKKVKKFGEGGWGMKLPRKDDSSIKKLPTKMSPKDESGIKKLPTKMPSKDGSGIKKFGGGGDGKKPVKKLTGPGPARPLEFPIRGRSISIPLDEPKPTPRKIPPKITKTAPVTPVDREEARKYREDLKKVKVSPAEGRVIESANRSEGGGHKKGGMMKMADKAGRAMTRKTADTMGRAMVKKAGGGKCYAKGGSVSSRADGVAKKGKTHTKMVKMAMGGVGTGRASMASEPGMQTPRGERVTVRPKAPPVVKSPKPVGPKFGMYMGSKKGGIVGKKKGGYC